MPVVEKTRITAPMISANHRNGFDGVPVEIDTATVARTAADK
jgi:hypothetical protein